MPVTGDQVQAQSLEEEGMPSRTLRGTLEIIDVAAFDYYPAFTAFFVDGQEADETTITPQQDQNTITAARAEPTPTKGPYDRYASVFEAAEKLSGNHPYGSMGTLSYYSDVQRQAVRIALGLPTQFIEDRDFLREAAILMSAIPQSPLSPGALYRGTQEFEISRKRDGIEVFDHFDMPLAPATPHRKTAESFAKGLLIKISNPIPWIKTEGTAKLEEGFISGRFIVTAITFQPNNTKVVTVTQTGDYLMEAYAVLAENGWDYGEDHSFNLTASAALVLPKLYDYTKIYDDHDIFAQIKKFYAYLNPFQNDCHSPEDGRFCSDPTHSHKNPSDIHEAVYMAGERFGGDASGGGSHYQNMQDAADRIAAGKDVGNKLNTRSGKELADKDAALLMAALPATSKNSGTLYRGTAPDEGSPYDPTARGRRELSPGDEITLPLTAVTLDERVAKDRVYNRGAIFEFPEGTTPFIPIQGIVGGLSEGITGGKFRVKAVDYQSNLDGVTETQRVVLEHIADHGSEARQQMKDNGWTFGPDLSLQASGLEEFGKRKGNFEALRRWYNTGGGADRIAWGTKGDFTRCMKLVAKYIPAEDVGGFCQNRHMEIYGESNQARDARQKSEAVLEVETLANDCHSPKDGRFCETHGSAYDNYTSVYLAAERMAGLDPLSSPEFDDENPSDYYPNVQRAALAIAKGEDVPKTPYDRDAAILMAGLPNSPVHADPLYRATGKGEYAVGDTVDMPIGSVSPLKEATDTYNGGTLFTIRGAPYTRVAGFVGINEGLVSGRFTVTKVNTSEGQQQVEMKYAGDFTNEARTQMKKNTWSLGPNLAKEDTTARARVRELAKQRRDAVTAEYRKRRAAEIASLPKDSQRRRVLERAIEREKKEEQYHKEHPTGLLAAVFANPCHDPETGRFCETPGAPGHEGHAGVPGEGNMNPVERDDDWFQGPDEMRGSTMWPDGVRPLADQYAKDVTEDEWQALRAYTTNDYRYVNRRLDDPTGYNAEPEYADGQIKLIDSALEKTPTFSEPIEVYRGVAMPHLSQEQVKAYVDQTYTPGAEVSMSKGGYQSTSLGVEAPLDQSLSKTNNGFVFEIKAYRGAPLMGSTTFLDESEVLISRHDRFRVVAVQHDVTFIKGIDQDEVQRTVIQVEQIV